MLKTVMYPMKLAWHERQAMSEHEFSEISDKIRDQLKEQGMCDREATIKAPIMLEGIDLALQGKLDFKRVREELGQEKALVPNNPAF